MTLLFTLLACAPDVLELDVTRDASGASVEASVPMHRIELWDATGGLVVARQLVPPTTTTALRAPLSAGAYEVRAFAGDQSARSPFEVPQCR